MGETYQVILTQNAQADIRKIYDYLLETASYGTAEHVKAGIEEEITKLSDMPESRGLLRGIESQTIYRRVLKWSYRIIFTVDENKLRVVVLRVDHAKSDPAELTNLP